MAAQRPNRNGFGCVSNNILYEFKQNLRKVIIHFDKTIMDICDVL